MNSKDVCAHDHHGVIPILVVLFAICFLLKYQGLLTADAVNVIWPILVGIGGLVMLIEDRCDCC